MKLMLRRATRAVALTLVGTAVPAAVDAQVNRNMPLPDTPRLMVAVFQSSDRAVGVAVADAIRTRLINVSRPRDLAIITKEVIANYLTSSGYRADSSLGLTDLKELAKGLRADEVVGGFVTRAEDGGLRIEARLMSAVDPTMAQPLPTVGPTTNLNDAARQIERLLQPARRQWDEVRACQNGIRDNAMPKAFAAARKAIAEYENATIARICLANAFAEAKMHDSTLAVTAEIMRLDPRSAWGPRLEFLSWSAKADAERDSLRSQDYRERSVRALVLMLAADRSNLAVQAQVVTELGKLGKPEVALPIVDELLQNNPGDMQLLRQRWLLLLTAAQQTADSAQRPAAFDRAVAAGEAWVRHDSTLADSVYFDRQIRAASGVSSERQAQVAEQAVRRYPANQEFWWYKANAEYRAGKLDAAAVSINRLLALNPRYMAGAISPSVVLGQIFLQQKKTDSAIALARRAVASGEDSKTWGSFLLQPARDLVNQAQELQRDSTKAAETIAVWEAALAIAQEADRLNPQAASKFFIGISSFYVGADAYQKGAAAQRIRSEAARKTAGCAPAKRAQDMFLLTQLNLPSGGSLSPQTAQLLLGYVAQMAPGADEMVRRFCA